LSVHQSCSARIRYGRVDVPWLPGWFGGGAEVGLIGGCGWLGR